jgi:hypothetical protein
LNQGAEKLIWGYPDSDSLSVGLSIDVGPAPVTEVGGLIAVEPDSVMTVPLAYELPWKTVRSLGENRYEYRLLAQKQPGIDSDVVIGTVNLPAGAQLLDVSPNPTATNSNWLKFEFNLDTDKEVVVGFMVEPSN